MKGFTLLEVLIATALTAVILTSVYGAYVSNLDSVQAGREAARMQQTSRIFFDLVAKDVRCALGGDFLGVVGGLEGEDQEVQGRPVDQLRMLTSASHGGVGGMNTGLFRVAYGMAVREDEAGFILYRDQVSILGEANSVGQQTYELTRMANGLDFRFLDAKGREFKSWPPVEGQDHGDLPSLLRVSLRLRSASGQERVFVTSIRPELAGDPQ